MAFFTSRFAAATALVASFAMVAPPVTAAQLPAAQRSESSLPVAKGWSVDQETVNRSRRGGYGGWGRHRHRHGNGIDTGDVLAGVLILGGIAAIATAASNSSRDRDNDRYREPDSRYLDNDRESSSYQPSGLDRAADMCVREVERSEPVASVESVDRIASGWEVEGRLSSGRSFSCNIDNSGRVGQVELDARTSANDRQWDDDAYARARDQREAGPDDGEEPAAGG